MKLGTLSLSLAVLCAGASLASAQTESWDKDNGKPAPRLMPAGWVGTPVSLDALRRTAGEGDAAGTTQSQQVGAVDGNTVVLAFWNADIPC